MKAVQHRLTYSEFRLLPEDGKRYELINGEVIVTPAPSEKHQRVSMRLASHLFAFAEQHKLGSVYAAPFEVVLNDRLAFQPDIVFVSAARRHIIGPEYILGVPDLVVEILSPHRPALDRVTKFEQYAQHGVPEYWIVDPVGERVEVFRLSGSDYELRARLSGEQNLESPLFPGWCLSVQALFAS
ncbi:MAG: Uma2 family endonuclease [Acidobacteriia bacterium]|nr:Uma2 family endonuclease [Terriglobia bacterium]